MWTKRVRHAAPDPRRLWLRPLRSQGHPRRPVRRERVPRPRTRRDADRPARVPSAAARQDVQGISERWGAGDPRAARRAHRTGRRGCRGIGGVQPLDPACAHEPARPFPRGMVLKPSAIVCYSAGAYGGVRAAMQLRMMLAELGMSSIPSIFPVPVVQQAFAEDGTPSHPKTRDRMKKFLDELEWYAEALRRQRNRPQERSECEAEELVGKRR